MAKRFLASVGLVIATVGMLASCSAPDRGYVQREWSDTFRELGIVPLFPPREDVKVGDVYAYAFDPESDAVRRILRKDFDALSEEEKRVRMAVGMSPRMWRDDFGPDASKEYSRTPSFPQTDSVDVSLLAGIDAEAGVQAARERVSDVNAKAATAVAAETDATAGLAQHDAKIKQLQAEVETERKVPANETPADLEARLGRLAKVEAALQETQEGRKALVTALNKAKEIVRLRKEEVGLARKMLEIAEARLVNPPKRFSQPTDSTYDMYEGKPLPTGAPKSRVNRLRLVAFPDFSSTTFTEGNLSAMVPIEALMVGINANFSNIRRVTVRVPAAESYAVSIGTILADGKIIAKGDADAAKRVESFTNHVYMSSECHARGCRWGRGFSERLAKAFASGTQMPAADCDSCECCRALVRDTNRLLALGRSLSVPADKSSTALKAEIWNGISRTYPVTTVDEACSDIFVRIPTEVFYARALDVSIFAATSGGGRVSVNELAKEGEDRSIASPGDLGAIDPSGAQGSDLLTRSRAQLGTVQPAPGGAVQLVSMSELAVGLRRTYDRPVAIGFRGITLRVNRLTGIVIGAQVSDGAAPTEAGLPPSPTK
ncbi:MAG TPA: hypothetical protein VF777_16090 [Phycisphaerales bacterium]